MGEAMAMIQSRGVTGLLLVPEPVAAQRTVFLSSPIRSTCVCVWSSLRDLPAPKHSWVWPLGKISNSSWECEAFIAKDLVFAFLPQDLSLLISLWLSSTIRDVVFFSWERLTKSGKCRGEKRGTGYYLPEEKYVLGVRSWQGKNTQTFMAKDLMEA